MEHIKNLSQEKNWYDKSYKILLIIPVIFMVFSVFYLVSFYEKNGDILNRDTSLKGGTTITIPGDLSLNKISTALQKNFPDVSVKAISEIRTGKQIALIIESSAEPETLKKAVEEIIGYTLDSENSTIEFSGESLGKSFYKQLGIALLFSFILICIVIFVMFKTLVPSTAVIFAIVSDIVMTVAVVNLIGLSISAAGIAAFLMLIGYSVDTDILLTTRVIKNRTGTINQRIYSAFRTGMFMTGAGLIAVFPALFLITSLPDSFRQIFIILAIGLIADIFNTWLTNASIIKWYAESKKL